MERATDMDAHSQNISNTRIESKPLDHGRKTQDGTVKEGSKLFRIQTLAMQQAGNLASKFVNGGRPSQASRFSRASSTMIFEKQVQRIKKQGGIYMTAQRLAF